MKKLFVLGLVAISIALVGCNDPETVSKSGDFKQLYQSGDGGANTDFHVYEDLVTGNLLYQEDSHGTFHIVKPTAEDIKHLIPNGYVIVK